MYNELKLALEAKLSKIVLLQLYKLVQLLQLKLLKFQESKFFSKGKYALLLIGT